MDAASYGGKIYVAGGYTGNWVPSDALLIYDSDTDSWEFGEKMPTVRGALAAEFVGNALYALEDLAIEHMPHLKHMIQ